MLYLDNDTIDANVAKNRKGVYGLDRGAGGFKVYYVGRSDSCLNDRLKRHVGEKYRGSTYRWFKFAYASSEEEAYNMECECYHYHGGKEELDNEEHPKKPEGRTDLKCPVCGQDC